MESFADITVKTVYLYLERRSTDFYGVLLFGVLHGISIIVIGKYHGFAGQFGALYVGCGLVIGLPSVPPAAFYECMQCGVISCIAIISACEI